MELMKAILFKLLNALIFGAFKKAYSNKEYLRYFLQTTIGLRKQRIRVSVSALIRIQLDGKLLLVRGNRIKHQFQPVGGVLKSLPSAKPVFDNMGVSSDYDSYGFDNDIQDDLRVRLPAKKLIAFLKWYNSEKDRESDPFREFHEELVATGILTVKVFPHIQTAHVRQVLTPIHFSNHFQCHELMIAEIYDLLPSQEQQEALRNTMTIQSDEFKWVSESAIRRRGHDQHEPIVIAETAEWLLNN